MTAPEKPAPGPAWPLFVIAALSFIPVLGIFFGGAAATWGLVSKRRRAMLAAMIAMAGALANMGGLVVYAVRSGGGSGGMSGLWVETAKIELTGVVMDLEKYHAREHAYPASLHALPGYGGRFQLRKLLDQSGGPLVQPHEFQYILSADGETYDLFGTGPDNTPGTADDVRPVLTDSLKAHSGYRPQPVAPRP